MSLRPNVQQNPEKKGGGHTCHKIKSPHEIIKPYQKDEEEKWDKGALGWEEKKTVSLLEIMKREEER